MIEVPVYKTFFTKGLYNAYLTVRAGEQTKSASCTAQVSDELADALKETHSQSIENFATKADLANNISNSESKIEQKIELVRKEIEMSKQEVIIKLGRVIYFSVAFLATLTGLAVAILKF